MPSSSTCPCPPLLLFRNHPPPHSTTALTLIDNFLFRPTRPQEPRRTPPPPFSSFVPSTPLKSPVFTPDPDPPPPKRPASSWWTSSSAGQRKKGGQKGPHYGPLFTPQSLFTQVFSLPTTRNSTRMPEKEERRARRPGRRAPLTQGPIQAGGNIQALLVSVPFTHVVDLVVYEKRGNFSPLMGSDKPRAGGSRMQEKKKVRIQGSVAADDDD